jgi:heat shock protein HslJ
VSGTSHGHGAVFGRVQDAAVLSMEFPMQALLALLALCACLVAGACHAAEGGSGASPEGTWTLVELEGIDVAALGRAPELTIGADGAVSGFAGVNRFSGRAVPETLGKGELLVGPLAVTRMAGEPRAMEAESRFLALLTSRIEWRRSEGELTLRQGGKVKASFRAATGG